MRVYVMTWHDRHVDDKITVHLSFEGALASLRAEADDYDLEDGETWNELGSDVEGRAYCGSNDGDIWGDINPVEVQS